MRTPHARATRFTETSDPSGSPSLGGGRWNTWETGVTLAPQEFVDQSIVLLQGVMETTGASEPGLFVEQLRATLGFGTPESSFQLPLSADAAPVTRQLGAQADLIADGIIARVQGALERVTAEPIVLPAGSLVVRSRCDGHWWTSSAVQLLTGMRGGPVAMQLYNEWLHQMVLLRDALLPFVNWTEVPLMVTSVGLRRLDSARERFLAEALFRQVRHTTIVDYARRVVTDTSGPAGYGFDCAEGTALPAVVHGPLSASASHLLAWRPAEGGTATSGVTTYVYETEDYYAAPRTPLESLPTVGQDAPGRGPAAPVAARVATDPAAGDTRRARIELTGGSGAATVDLGQALRGHRFSYRQSSDHAPDDIAGEAPTPRRQVEAWTVLSAPGLVRAQEGDWFIDAVAVDETVRLALLGKLYPENVVLRRGADRGTAVTVGKDGPARILVEVDG